MKFKRSDVQNLIEAGFEVILENHTDYQLSRIGG